ncbi:hypothetical protein, partial [Pseudonocardia sp.]|uniref:hypothetical protein n=1 Tax=Pseudonocardia sp. TaxID=60912 RepID=UPI003D14F510
PPQTTPAASTLAPTSKTPSTLPPTTLPPTTLPPTTLPPTTLPPTTGPSASAGPAATTTQPPVPAPPAQLVVGDSGVPLLAVAAPATGVPAAPQAGGRIAEADGRTVVVLAATEEPAVRPGRAVTVRGADGAERTWTVRVLRPVPEPALTPALAPAGGLLVVMGGPGARTVLIAT